MEALNELLHKGLVQPGRALFRAAHDTLRLFETMVRHIAECESVHRELQRNFHGRDGANCCYVRLNPPLDRSVHMDNIRPEAAEHLRQATERYLDEPAVQIELDKICAMLLARRRVAADMTLSGAPAGPLCLLAIDGGGVKGLVPALMMQRLEKMCGCPINQLFNLVGGTSTGGKTETSSLLFLAHMKIKCRRKNNLKLVPSLLLRRRDTGARHLRRKGPNC